MTEKKRWYLDSDGDRWYIVPCSRREEFTLWRDQDWHNELADFIMPDYVTEVDGIPEFVTFTNPVDEN